MRWINIGLIVVSAINLILAVLIWLRNSRNKINIYFSLALISVAFWGISETLLLTLQSQGGVVFWGIATFIFGLSAAAHFLLFSFYFPFERPKTRGGEIASIYLFFLASVMFSISPGFLVNGGIVGTTSVKNHLIIDRFGFWIYLAVFIFYFAWAYFNLILKYIHGEEFAKRQLRYLITGTLIATIVAIIFDLLIPYFEGEVLGWVGPYTTLLITFAVAYLLFFVGNKIKVH